MSIESDVQFKVRQFEMESTVRSIESDMLLKNCRLPDSNFVSAIKFEGVPILPPVVSTSDFRDID